MLWLSDVRLIAFDLSPKLLLVLKPDTECLSLIDELFSTANACRVKCLVLAAPYMAISTSITTTYPMLITNSMMPTAARPLSLAMLVGSRK